MKRSQHLRRAFRFLRKHRSGKKRSTDHPVPEDNGSPSSGEEATAHGISQNDETIFSPTVDTAAQEKPEGKPSTPLCSRTASNDSHPEITGLTKSTDARNSKVQDEPEDRSSTPSCSRRAS